MGDGNILRGRCHRDGVRDGGGGPSEEAIDLGKYQKIMKNMIENAFVLEQRALAWLEPKSLFSFCKNGSLLGKITPHQTK